MKWMRVLGVVVGLVAGILWIIFAISHITSSRMIPDIWRVVMQSFIVGFAVVVSSLIAFRWSVIGGVLLLLEGVTPLILLFLMSIGYPLFFSIVSGLTIVSGLFFLFSGSKT
jgi:hypothetical protein